MKVVRLEVGRERVAAMPKSQSWTAPRVVRRMFAPRGAGGLVWGLWGWEEGRGGGTEGGRGERGEKSRQRGRSRPKERATN